MDIPVLGVAGYSGSGKTTLICNLIKILKEKGIRTAVIKHDVHGISEDDDTKDTGRFRRAGACLVKLCCGRSDIEEEKRMLDAAITEVSGAAADIDIILVEGFKRLQIPKLGIARRATGKGLCSARSGFLAVVSDVYEPDKGLHQFALDDYEGICEFVMERSISERRVLYQ